RVWPTSVRWLRAGPDFPLFARSVVAAFGAAAPSRDFSIVPAINRPAPAGTPGSNWKFVQNDRKVKTTAAAPSRAAITRCLEIETHPRSVGARRTDVGPVQSTNERALRTSGVHRPVADVSHKTTQLPSAARGNV